MFITSERTVLTNTRRFYKSAMIFGYNLIWVYKYDDSTVITATNADGDMKLYELEKTKLTNERIYEIVKRQIQRLIVSEFSRRNWKVFVVTDNRGKSEEIEAKKHVDAAKIACGKNIVWANRSNYDIAVLEKDNRESRKQGKRRVLFRYQ